MAWTSPQLTGLLLRHVPAGRHRSVVSGRVIKGVSASIQTKLGSLAKVAEEASAACAPGRPFVGEARELRRYNEKVPRRLRAGKKESVINSGFFAMAEMGGDIMLTPWLVFAAA